MGSGFGARRFPDLGPWVMLAVAAVGSAAFGATPRVVRINCGGGAFVDPCGRSWQADFWFDGGTTEIAQIPIAGTGMPALYQTGRWSDGPLGYSIPCGADLAKEIGVVLHFAEIFPGNCAQGRRIFEVWIEGKRVGEETDIVREAGCLTALARTYKVRTEGDTVEIALLPVRGSPKISGIEIYQDPASIERCSPCPSELVCDVAEGPSVRLRWRNRSLDYPSIIIVRDGAPVGETGRHAQEYLDSPVVPGLHAYRLRVPGGPGGECETDACWVLVGPPYRVNCGAGAWEDPRGDTWWPEPGPEQGATFSVQDLGIFGTDSEPLFRSQRVGTADGPPLFYSFWVPEGIWRVTLHLAEVYERVDEIGERTFDVWIAEDRTAEGVDILARAGFASATSIGWDARVPAGLLEIALVRREGVPAVAAIEIASSPSPVPGLPALTSTLDEDGVASFAWGAPPVPADRIVVQRDGLAMAELPGDATSWIDPAVPEGAHEYAFAPVRRGIAACPRRTAVELPPLWINCGGYGFQALTGQKWGPDRGYRGGERRQVELPLSVQGAPDTRLYAAWRRGAAAEPSIRYALPVVRGRLHRVVLHFADVEPMPIGATFAVRVDGAVVRRALDITATFGSNAAGSIAFDVAPPSGEITIALDPVGGVPRISAIEILPLAGFLRGDVWADGELAINDPIVLLMHLFADGPPPICPDAADADDDGGYTIGDAISLLNYLFASGPAPASPAERRCGADPTPDTLPPCDYRACPPDVVETEF